MKKSPVLAVLVLGLASAAFAGSVLYSNIVPANIGQISPMSIANGNYVSNSFTLSSTSTVGGANFDVWLNTGPLQSLTSVKWSIGTTYDGSQEGSGTATVTSDGLVGHGYNSSQYPIVEYTISLPSESLGAGTYWLTLQGAVASPQNPGVAWDVSDGPSANYYNGASQAGGYGYYEPGVGDVYGGSDQFQILGPVPEGGAGLMYLLLAGACLACAFRARGAGRTLLA
jgi:hypothetical protein